MMTEMHPSQATEDVFMEPQRSGDVKPESSFVVDVDGFEGPLDLLLALARSQKVDLTKVSILALAEQYLAFVAEARKIRLELAADYLVMAAWLAYLKSRLLLPEQKDDDEPTGEELAQALAFRLRRLEAMREAAGKLMNRNRLGRDVFCRGMPEAVSISKRSEWSATLYDVLMAYAAQRQRSSVSAVKMQKRTVWSLQEAREILTRLLGRSVDWAPIESFFLDYIDTPEDRATVMASSFSASLELVREGALELRQTGAYKPLYIRAIRQDDGTVNDVDTGDR